MHLDEIRYYTKFASIYNILNEQYTMHFSMNSDGYYIELEVLNSIRRFLQFETLFSDIHTPC